MLVIGQQRGDGRSRLLPRIASDASQLNVAKCPHCRCALRRTKSHNDDGIAYCGECGFVASSIGQGTFNRSNSKKHSINRYDKPSYPRSNGHHRTIGYEDAMLGTDTNQQQKQWNISELWLKYSKASDQTEKNFAMTLAEITKLVSALSFEVTLCSRAADMCKSAFENSLSRGNSLSVLAAALVYASARQASLPVTADEVAVKSSLPKRDIIRCFRKLQRKLDLNFQPSSPQAYSSRILALLSLSPQRELATMANKMLEKAEKSGIVQGKNPNGAAAAAIYLVANLNGCLVTQRELARIAHVTETTIRNACKDLSGA